MSTDDQRPASAQDGSPAPPSPQEQLEESERKARVNAAWEQMNKGMSAKAPKTTLTKKSNPPPSKKTNSHNWMGALGLKPTKTETRQKRAYEENGTSSEDTKKLAAIALSAVKDAAALSAAVNGRGKVEITQIRDFAGENIQVKKLVDPESKEAAESKPPCGQPLAVDVMVEQLKKKNKISVLDKTKKDWGEFKEDKKLDEELNQYKKSSNQYLDKVSFLQRTDMREFERERDVRLALQSKRRSDM